MPDLFDRQEAFALARGEGGLNQDALVRRLRQQGPPKIQTRSRKIPMGNMIPELLTTQRDLEEAVYTWLRAASDWEELTIAFASSPEDFKLKEELVTRFPNPKEDTPPWKRESDGVWQLRERVARLLLDNKNVVKIRISKEGITLSTDADAKFGPYRKATAKDVAAFNDELDKVLDDQKQAAELQGLEWVAPEIPRLKVGDQISNEAFDPTIHWIKEKRGVGIQD